MRKFLNISTESKVNSRFIIFWITLAFLIMGGLFVYEYWWKIEGVSLIRPKVETLEFESGIIEGGFLTHPADKVIQE